LITNKIPLRFAAKVLVFFQKKKKVIFSPKKKCKKKISKKGKKEKKNLVLTQVEVPAWREVVRSPVEVRAVQSALRVPAICRRLCGTPFLSHKNQ